MANTIASVLRKTGGSAPGLGQTRALLVIAWVAFQSIRVTDGNGGAVFSPLWIVPYAVVPALFAVLGFCLAQAAAGQSARAFAFDRVRRAGPVLLAAVLAAALLIGPAITTSGLRAYLTDPAFALYFLNLVGWPRFDLPGVFEFNDYSEVVNEALWLTPCFAIVAIVALGAMRSRAPRWFALLGAGITLAGYAAAETAGLMPLPGGSVIRNSFVGSGLAAILAGQCGTLCYAWRSARRSCGRRPAFWEGWRYSRAPGSSIGRARCLPSRCWPVPGRWPQRCGIGPDRGSRPAPRRFCTGRCCSRSRFSNWRSIWGRPGKPLRPIWC